MQKQKKQKNSNQECEESFQKLKELYSSTAILAHAEYPNPFMLHTDACGLDLGVVIYQQQGDGTERVIGYASHKLSKSERNYPAQKLEFLALKWAVSTNMEEHLMSIWTIILLHTF